MKIFPALHDHKRRTFLKLSGLLGLGVATATLLPFEKVESVLFHKSMYKVSQTRTAMGTLVNMTVIHPSRDEAENAMGLAFAEVDRLCALMTRYGNQSEICELNAENCLERPAPEIREVVDRSLYFHRDTNGAFDITVAPLVNLFQERFAAGSRPTEADADAVLDLIGSEQLRWANGSILLPQKGMGITLDGVAPGFIADRAGQMLAANGIVNHLVDGGGEIRVSGSAAKGAPWTVAIQDPAKKKEYPDVLSLREGAVSTSGNYEVYYDREKVFHHIVNGRTGQSPHLSTSVTVMAPTAMDADILSTAVFVMEPEAGIRYVNARPGYECFVVDRQGRTIKSNGWPT
ncbi:MAG: FAD:protein FMN transferase [Desulfobulbus sp.]|nr:FAD:protein FMN transferase [Desulfobulbus sp.]